MRADVYAGATRLSFVREVAYDVTDLRATTIGHLPSDLLMTQPRPLRLFISYAHEDNLFRQGLEKHLSPLKRQGLVEIWSDRVIEAGQEWEQSIHDALEAAEIILLLISPDFVASKYIYNEELKRAMERHEAGGARVIPVILRQCDWKYEVFGKLQGVPDNVKPIAQWEDRDEAFQAVARAIRQAAGSLRSLYPEPERKAPHASPPAQVQQPDFNAPFASEVILWERFRSNAADQQALAEFLSADYDERAEVIYLVTSGYSVDGAGSAFERMKRILSSLDQCLERGASVVRLQIQPDGPLLDSYVDWVCGQMQKHGNQCSVCDVTDQVGLPPMAVVRRKDKSGTARHTIEHVGSGPTGRPARQAVFAWRTNFQPNESALTALIECLDEFARRGVVLDTPEKYRRFAQQLTETHSSGVVKS